MYVTNELHARKAFKYILLCSEFHFKLRHFLCLAFQIYILFLLFTLYRGFKALFQYYCARV